MTDFIKANTKLVTKQVTDEGSTIIIGGDPEINPRVFTRQSFITDFLLTDIIFSSSSSGQVTIVAEDDNGRTHVVAVLRGKDKFSHAFEGGWVFWSGARLTVIKEKTDGIVDLAVGYVKVTGPDYSIWRN